MPGRTIGQSVSQLVHKADFERVLQAPTRSRSTHFSIHHVSGRPTATFWRAKPKDFLELSTDPAPVCLPPVDDSPRGYWLGSVIPKRHARRSVTRNLLKRQVRSAMARHAARLPPGLWLVRLRAPFGKGLFPSAASTALRNAARAELEQLFARAAA
jgi:ribonuclease P protein component